MNKEIKDRLDKLENELKESKNEIHSLKSSVSLKIERGIGELLSRFSRKKIIIGSLIALFSISIIGIAGTVTKTYTFSSGDVVSASKINANFDTLFNLVNGNLDENNISFISDGSADGYIKIGNMQIVWGNDGVPDVAHKFPKSFTSKPTTYFDCGSGTWTTSAMTNASGDCNPYGYFAIGKWQ
jgi:hypothetical protein